MAKRSLASLTGADLSGTLFTGCTLTGALFDGADLTAARFDACDLVLPGYTCEQNNPFPPAPTANHPGGCGSGPIPAGSRPLPENRPPMDPEDGRELSFEEIAEIPKASRLRMLRLLKPYTRAWPSTARECRPKAALMRPVCDITASRTRANAPCSGINGNDSNPGIVGSPASRSSQAAMTASASSR